ncbi:MAG: hypothetical protein LBI18_06300 [Planctomycetaceae bacterium]|nr:hypothetical protein [Planctomycetaceae bacterium]
MNNQYHFEQESSMRKSHADQATKFFTHDWETANDHAVSFPDDLLEGKIIAQMPDLGECRTISESMKSKQQSENWLNRIYSGFVSVSSLPKWIGQSLPKINFHSETFRSLFVGKQNVFRNLIIICLLVFVIGGGVLIHKSNKKKTKESVHHDVAQKVETLSNTSTSVESSASATPKPTAPPAEKAEKSATPKPAVPPAEKPVTPKPAASPAEKPATPKPAAVSPPEKPAITAPAVTVAATSPKVSEKAKSDQKSNQDNTQNNVNSPWERSATDNYSPWTMNSPGRLEASTNTLETGGISATPANPVIPTPYPAAPQPHPATTSLMPMTPIVPIQPETAANTVINHNNNTNTPIVNTTNTVNNPVPSSVASQPVLPGSPNHFNGVPVNGVPVNSVPGSDHVATVYWQPNTPVSQNYLTSYRRDTSPVAAPIQPIPSATPSAIPPQAYPPPTYNGQTGQNQQGQYDPNRRLEPIVPPSYQGVPTANHIATPIPMQGVAPQPVPVPMTGTMPIPIQPIAPIPGTVSQPIPHGMIPPAGGVGSMPMSQPIPIQVTAPIPQPTHSQPPYHSVYAPSAPLANNPAPPPSYYPPTSTTPYYQQSNTPTPYRRLY